LKIGKTTFEQLGELKKTILDRQNERAAAQQASFINQRTPTQSTIRRIPSFIRANAYEEHHWSPENVRPALFPRRYPLSPIGVTSSPLQRPATPNGPRTPLTARPSTPRMQNYPHPFRRFAGAFGLKQVGMYILITQMKIDSPMPRPKEGKSALLRRCTSFVQPLHRHPELNLRHPTPNIPSSTKPPSWSPAPMLRTPLNPCFSSRSRRESLRPQKDRHPLRPNSRADENKFEFKKKLKERRKACHEHSTSDSSRFDTEGFFSSLTSD